MRLCFCVSVITSYSIIQVDSLRWPTGKLAGDALYVGIYNAALFGPMPNFISTPGFMEFVELFKFASVMFRVKGLYFTKSP